jgi:putative membrane protein
VFYHLVSENTKYGDEGFVKYIYLFILITHIVLAALSFPFILWTLFLGLTNQVQKHRKIAKIVFPVWLYVAITGVVVYIMISPYYTN